MKHTTTIRISTFALVGAALFSALSITGCTSNKNNDPEVFREVYDKALYLALNNALNDPEIREEIYNRKNVLTDKPGDYLYYTIIDDLHDDFDRKLSSMK